MTDLLTIQQVAAESGLSTHTLRYYERIGLIKGVDRAGTGHRRYSSDDLVWIAFLKKLRATGMPVAAMKQYADLTRAGDQTLGDRIDLLETHRCAILEQMAILQEFVSILDYKIDYYSQEKERYENSMPALV